jgi:uncharacterized caspase-like protein
MKHLLSAAVISVLFFTAAGCCLLPIDENIRFYALIIGINDYTDPGVADLSYCVDDANDFKSSLVNNGWKESEIVLLTDGGATKLAILNTLTSFVDQATADDYLLIYYSGHGTNAADLDGDEPDSTDEAIVPVDYVYGDDTTLILDDELGGVLSESITEKGIFIFDACNSGGLINKALSSEGSNTRFARTSNIKGGATNGDLDITKFPVLAASGQYEFSYENSDLQHGVFTYFILKGMVKLRADTDRDGYITVRELFNYAENQTRNYVKYYYGFAYQHPQLRYPREFLDILVTR